LRGYRSTVAIGRATLPTSGHQEIGGIRVRRVGRPSCTHPGRRPHTELSCLIFSRRLLYCIQLMLAKDRVWAESCLSTAGKGSPITKGPMIGTTLPFSEIANPKIQRDAFACRMSDPSEPAPTKAEREPFYCPHCQALYVMISRKVPGHDEGSASCQACGEAMKSWSGCRVFSFQLLRGSGR